LNNHNNLKELALSNNKITHLKITNCPNLKQLCCSSNSLTELNLQNFPNLEEVIFSYNDLVNLDLSKCKNLTSLYCCDNQLTTLQLPENKKNLYKVWLLNNKLKQNLSIFSEYTNLTELYIGNYLEKEECFYGSLETLKNLTNLIKLDISHTDIGSGVEHLPESLKEFYCFVTKSRNPISKVSAIRNLFADDQGNVETKPFEKSIKNFVEKLQNIKDKFKSRKILVNELTKQDQLIQQLCRDNSSLKEEKVKLEEELTIERETNQASAELMDDFYRQQFIKDKDPESIVRNNFANQYLELNLENKQNRLEIERLKKELELAKKIIENKELYNVIEIPLK
jgi:hypothetical protein